MTAKKVASLLALSLVFTTTQLATAQEFTGIAVKGKGTVSLKPERIRLSMVVSAQGRDAKSAVVALRSHKERVIKELTEMKASKASIKFSAATIGPASEEQADLLRMQMRMMPESGANSKPEETPSPVTSYCRLQAEWPLPVQEGDALAILPSTLLEQLKARDIEGEENTPDWSEEEKEKLEEMQAMFEDSYGYYGGSSGEENISIEFVADVTNEAVAEATAKAFKAAAADAQVLADASGLALGKLKAISKDIDFDIDDPYGFYSPQYGRLSESMDDDERIITSQTSDGLKCEVTVDLLFGFAS